MGGATLFRCSALLVDAATALRDASVLVVDGVVREVGSGPGAARRLGRAAQEQVEFEGGWVSSGLVNAHAHLDLTALGSLSAAGGFGAWVGRVLEARSGLDAPGLEAGARAGARDLGAGGTTAVGDVDSTGVGAPAAHAHGERVGAEHGPATLVYRESLDARDPRRTAAALEAAAEGLRWESALGVGLSPHAPFTVSEELLGGLGELARGRGARVTIHWSETEEEVAYLTAGAGPLGGLLGPSPRRRGLDLIEDAGLLGPTTSLVHGNHPAPGEPERLARAGVVLVHCPGTHAHFDRGPFPLGRYLDAGVSLALGTDGLVSNDALDMRQETARMRAAYPELPPGTIWEMATVGGARALGYEDRMGRVLPEHRADLCHWPMDAGDAGDAAAHAGDAVGAVARLVEDAPDPLSVWVGGRRIGDGRRG